MPIGTRNDPTKVLMGASLVPASEEAVESVPGNIAAGLCVRRNTSTGAYQVAASGAGPIVGLSRGKSLGGAGTFSLMHNAPKGCLQIDHTPTIGTQVHISDTTGKGSASGGGKTATAAIYEKVLLGGGIDPDTGSAVDVAIVNFTAGF